MCYCMIINQAHTTPHCDRHHINLAFGKDIIGRHTVFDLFKQFQHDQFNLKNQKVVVDHYLITFHQQICVKAAHVLPYNYHNYNYLQLLVLAQQIFNKFLASDSGLQFLKNPAKGHCRKGQINRQNAAGLTPVTMLGGLARLPGPSTGVMLLPVKNLTVLDCAFVLG